MYHSIVVGQDNSEFSHQALVIAMWLAKATRARLHLRYLHSRKPSIRPKSSLEVMQSTMETRLQECLVEGIAGDCRVVEGWTTQAFVVESKWHDLVVVGRHGESAHERARGIGSLPNALLAASPVPVLVAADSPAIPDQLLVVFDNSVDACAALRIAASLAAEKNLRIHVVETKSAHKKHDHLSHARAYLEDWKTVRADFEVLTGQSSNEIVTYVQTHGIQLTFLPALDRSLFGHKLTTRIAEETNSSLIVPRGRVPEIY